jgi:hypothetical protein
MSMAEAEAAADSQLPKSIFRWPSCRIHADRGKPRGEEITSLKYIEADAAQGPAAKNQRISNVGPTCWETETILKKGAFLFRWQQLYCSGKL